jgi:hypothetical protein
MEVYIPQKHWFAYGPHGTIIYVLDKPVALHCQDTLVTEAEGSFGTLIPFYQQTPIPKIFNIHYSEKSIHGRRSWTGVILSKEILYIASK